MRTTFIIVACISVILAIIGQLVRSGLLSEKGGIYITVVFVGSMIGSVYGAILGRPERNRWIRTFAIGTVFGTVVIVIESRQRVAVYHPLMWCIASGLTVVPACVTASLIEVFRKIIGRTVR